MSLSGKPPINVGTSSTDLRTFLDRCLEVDPRRRADADELLAHGFLKRSRRPSCLVPNIEATRKKGVFAL